MYFCLSSVLSSRPPGDRGVGLGRGTRAWDSGVEHAPRGRSDIRGRVGTARWSAALLINLCKSSGKVTKTGGSVPLT